MIRESEEVWTILFLAFGKRVWIQIRPKNLSNGRLFTSIDENYNTRG